MNMNQVTLAVQGFAESVAFYEALGLKLIVSARGEYARFECPGGAATLSLHLSAKPVTGQTVIYFETQDIDRRHAALVRAGLSFDSPPQDRPWRWREARLKDPSGNEICLYHAGENRTHPPWRIG